VKQSPGHHQPLHATGCSTATAYDQLKLTGWQTVITFEQANKAPANLRHKSKTN